MTAPFRRYIETHQVFTTDDVLESCGSTASMRTALSRAVADGQVSKVRNALYISNTGRFVGLRADPYRVAAAFDTDAVFSFHSALELHGLAHSLSNRVQYRSPSARLSFTFDGTSFERYSSREDIPIDSVRADSYGEVRVTTREQTFLDCMSRMRLCGGAEEVLHSLAGLPYLNLATVVELLDRHPASVVARVGWYLEANAERLDVADAMLEGLQSKLPPKASYYLDSTSRKDAQAFSSRWKLNLPTQITELESWMEL